MCNKEMGIGEKFCPGDALLLLSEAAAASIWQNQRLSFNSGGPFDEWVEIEAARKKPVKEARGCQTTTTLWLHGIEVHFIYVIKIGRLGPHLYLKVSDS